MNTKNGFDQVEGGTESLKNGALDTQKAWELVGQERMGRITQAAHKVKGQMGYLGSLSTVDLACIAVKKVAGQIDEGKLEHPVGSKEFTSYIRKTVKSTILDSLKAARNRLRDRSDEMPDVVDQASGEEQLVNTLTLERVRERMEAFFAGEDELGSAYTKEELEEMKLILKLSAEEDLSSREIADRLGMSHQTVNRRLNFIRTQVLADFYEEEARNGQ